VKHYWCEDIKTGRLICWYCQMRPCWPGAREQCEFKYRDKEREPPPRISWEELENDAKRVSDLLHSEPLYSIWHGEYGRDGQRKHGIGGG